MLRIVALVRTTWRNIQEDTILHSHCPENLKSYIDKNCQKQLKVTKIHLKFQKYIKNYLQTEEMSWNLKSDEKLPIKVTFL
jgi:hypothetical protein